MKRGGLSSPSKKFTNRYAQDLRPNRSLLAVSSSIPTPLATFGMPLSEWPSCGAATTAQPKQRSSDIATWIPRGRLDCRNISPAKLEVLTCYCRFFRSIYVNLLGVVLIISVACLSGIAIFAYYVNCDPYKAGIIKKKDQVSSGRVQSPSSWSDSLYSWWNLLSHHLRSKDMSDYVHVVFRIGLSIGWCTLRRAATRLSTH